MWPFDPTDGVASMLNLSTAIFVVAAMGLLIVAVTGFRNRRYYSVVFGGLVGYALLGAANVESLSLQFGSDSVEHAAWVFLCGSTVISLTVQILASSLPPVTNFANLWIPSVLRAHSNWSFGFIVAALVLLVADRGDLSLNWNEARGDIGSLSVLGTFFFLLGSPGCVTAAYSNRPMRCLLLVLLSSVVFVLSGSRAAVLSALILAFWMIMSRSSGAFGKARILLASGIAAFFIHVVLRQVRGVGVIALAQAYADGNLVATLFSNTDNVDVSGGESAIAEYFVYSTKVASVHDFGFMTSIVRMLLFPVPHALEFIGKPIDITYRLWQHAYLAGLFDSGEGQDILWNSFLTGSLGSLHPTLFGEYYVAGGWPALVMSSVLMGGVLVLVDRYLGEANPFANLALAGPVMVGYLFIARGNSVIGIGYFFYLAILLHILRFIVNWMRRTGLSVLKAGLYLRERQNTASVSRGRE